MMVVVSPLSAGVMELPLLCAEMPIGIVKLIIHICMGANATHLLMLRMVAPAPFSNVNALNTLLWWVFCHSTSPVVSDGSLDRGAGGHKVRRALRNPGPSDAEETKNRQKQKEVKGLLARRPFR